MNDGPGRLLLGCRGRSQDNEEAANDPLCMPWGLPCTFRPYWASLGCRRVRRWLSRHVRRSLRSRRVARRFAGLERVPSHISVYSPLRPILPMEPAIHDVRCAVSEQKNRRREPAGSCRDPLTASRGVINLCCALRDQPVDAFKAPVAAPVGVAGFSRARHYYERPEPSDADPREDALPAPGAQSACSGPCRSRHSQPRARS